MVISVRKLIQQGKTSGNFTFEYNAPPALINIPYVSFTKAARVFGSYEILEDNEVYVSAEIEFELGGKCSRCLSDAKQSFTGSLEETFVTKSDGESYTYSNGELDLRQAVDDCIAFAIPTALICKEACEGIAYTEKNRLSEVN